jgi:Fic family protein
LNMFLHERDNWTDFRWDAERIALPLEEVSKKLGLLYGRLSGLGFDSQMATTAENLTRELVQSSEIEGIRLNADEVRSSIARRLGVQNIKFTAPSHYVESVVAVMVDALEHSEMPITKEILCGWQAAFFPTGYSEGSEIEVGQYRTHEEHIVSGALCHERVHYIAPSPDRVETEMQKFIKWYNSVEPIPFIIRSAVAHLWFVSIHTFEDGNGRLARILSDMMLARGDKSRFRFYNISTEINHVKNQYYDILERTQRGEGDITEWLLWYIRTLSAAIDNANDMVTGTLNKSKFWQRVAIIQMNERQRMTLNKYLDGYEAKITSKHWAQINNCSKDTAIRDIRDLVDKKVLREDMPGAKRPSYSIIYDPKDISQFFSEIKVEDGYIMAVYNGKPVRERLLALDASRFAQGDISQESLVDKYFSYLVNS